MKTIENKTLPYVTFVILILMLPIQLSLPLAVDLAIAGMGYILIYLLVNRSTLTLESLGLSKSQFRKSYKTSIAAALAIIALVGIVYLFDSSLFEDDRYQRSILYTAAYLLVLLPFQTAIFEELLFRGIIFASLKKKITTIKAATISSIFFGLWHILPSRSFSSPTDTISLGAFEQLAVISVLVLVTALAGLVLCYLREKFDSLYVPIFAHWAINGSGAIFAFLSFS